MRRLVLALAVVLALASHPLQAPAETVLPGAPPDGAPFGAALPAGHTAYSNESIADLFVTLTHDLEWGARRPHLMRYEAPVRVGMIGHGAGRYQPFVDQYLAELRMRAGVRIARTAPPHNLVVRFVPGSVFRARIPRHYCVIAPGRPDWDTFRRSPRRHGMRPFETATAIRAMTVFIPDDARPYLVRACLVEEIAQALGPANDLDGLGPSIFNDDAAHLWPTRLDFLVLRTLYAPELRSGLSRGETRTRALLALDRLNPEGRASPPLPILRAERMTDWAEALRAAFDRSRSPRRQLASAREALTTAARRAPFSVHHCRSLKALARAQPDDPRAALAALEDAARVCATAHGPDDIRVAQVRLDQARLLYLSGRASAAWGLSEGLEAQFAAHGQDERLAALYDLQAAVLQTTQEAPASAELLRRAGAWRTYALGNADADPRHWIGN
jgi:hypothetical protein